MLLFLFLFLSFLQIGLLSFGGDASAQAFIEHEVVTLHHWLTPEQMADLMAFSRVLPGSVALDAASLCGGMAAALRFGFWGTAAASALAVTGVVVPAVAWTALFERWQEEMPFRTHLECVLTLLRPLVPGLIAGAAILLMRPGNFGSPSIAPWDFGVSLFLFLATWVGVTVFRIKALFMVFLCGVAGWILL